MTFEICSSLALVILNITIAIMDAAGGRYGWAAIFCALAAYYAYDAVNLIIKRNTAK